MRRVPVLALLALGAAVASADPAAPEALLLSAAEVAPGWSVVEEAPVDADADPDLRGWGVRDRRARHYTRHGTGSVQVCSIEVWTFGRDAQARSAHAGFAYPDWRIDREGRVLVMLHGVVMQRGNPPRRGVFPDCDQLGARVRKRAERSRP